MVANRKSGYPDAVPTSQPLGDPGRGVTDGEAGLREDLLGSKVERREVVPPRVEQLLHFLLRHRWRHRHRARRAGIDAGHDRLIDVATMPVPVSYTHLTLPTNREV